MPTPLPLSLIFALSVMFCFVLANEQYEKILKRSPLSVNWQHLRLVEISGGFGAFSIIGIMIYYFISVPWYWPFALAFAGSTIGALMMGYLSVKIGEEPMGKYAFIGWPLSAMWAISIIHGIKLS